MTKRTTYTKEFKLEAIRLLEAGDKPGTQIARELGIRRNMLYKWQDQLSTKGEDAFKGRLQGTRTIIKQSIVKK
jgi:transposase-like protein